MSLTPGVRKALLTLHITASVGWVGAVIAYLVLVVAAMNSQDVQMVRAAWMGMEVMGWYAIVPLCVLALLSGLVQSLLTPWGLFRHYWVVIKLLLTVVATVVLLLTMPEISVLADAASRSASSGTMAPGLEGQLLHPGVGLVVLLVVTVLSVVKPRGLTPFGQRWQVAQRRTNRP